MGSVHVLLIDLGPHACPHDHSRQLTRMLHGFMSNNALNMQTVVHVPSETLSPPPNLIFLRPVATANLSALVQCLRRRWNLVPVVGLFCTGKHTPDAVNQALYNGLDDFLCCPLRDIDVFPRMQRLLKGQEAVLPTPHTNTG